MLRNFPSIPLHELQSAAAVRETERHKRQTVWLKQCHFKKIDRTHLHLNNSSSAHTLWCLGLYECCLIHAVLLAASLCVSLLSFLSLSPSSFPPSFCLSLSLCLFPPPPPLPAVFAGSFSARHPEAAVAPASLPTSVFVVGDDMSKLWRAGEGRERGREREGREGGSTSLCVEEKQGTQRECHVACSPPRYSLSLFLSRAVYVGRQEWRQEATPLLLPPFILPSALHSLSLSLLMPPRSTTPSFPLPHPTFHASAAAHTSSLISPGPVSFVRISLTAFYVPPPHLISPGCSVSLTHRRARAS